MLPGFPSTMAAAGLVGNLITLTPASGGGDVGYNQSQGSISGQPISGQTLNAMVSSGVIPQSAYIQFDGDVTAILADFGGVEINGVRIPITAWTYNGTGYTGKTRATRNGSTDWGFSAGVAVTVQLVA